MKNSITTEALKKSYSMGEVEVEALGGVDLEIEKGSFNSIMGPSGSGKSTLMHLIGLLDTPTSGKIHVEGKETSKLSERQRAYLRLNRIGFVFQFYSLLSGFSSLENVYMPLVMAGESRRKAVKKASETLEKVGLGDRKNHSSDELSGGERQRVAIARAIVNEPEIVLADEPASQLDTETSDRIMELFRQISSSGKTVVTVNHEERLGEKADRTIYLEDGEIKDR